MKINIIGTGLFLSGGMRIIFEYGNRLTRRGHDVIFYFPIKPYRFSDDSIRLQLKRDYWSYKDNLLNRRKVIVSYGCIFRIKAVPVISNVFIRDAEVSIATQWPTAYDVHNLSASKGKKIYFLQDYEIWGSKIENVDKSLRLPLDKITISKYNQHFFFTKFNIKSHVVLNGIDFNKYYYCEKSLNKKTTITFIDHPLADKGVVVAIEVIKQLYETFNNLEFVCFGHRKYHDLPEFVRFFENPDDKFVVEDIYGITDIFIYPSLKEGFALPPAEAMACKCAVVTTNVGAIPEFSVHGESAIHVRPNEPKEMYDAVVYLLQNKDEISRIAENGFKYVRSVLDWNSSVEKFEKILLS